MKSEPVKIESSISSLFHLLLLFVVFVLSVFNGIYVNYSFSEKSSKFSTSVTSEVFEGDVLSYGYQQKPQIYISGGNYKYSAGGVIPIASTDDPVVEVGGYNVSGKLVIDVYQADQAALLKYLIYKNENEQSEKEVNINDFKFISKIDRDINLHEYGSETKINLPLADRGIYYLRVNIGDTITHAYIVRSNIGAVVKEGNAEYIFWSQDFRSKKSLTSGNIKLYNLKDSIKEIANISIGNDGIARTFLTADADVALVIQDEETAIVPINLLYLNTGYSWQRFKEKNLTNRYFTFTDRPLYRPGDTVYFKSIVRDEDDVRYSIPNKSVNVSIQRGWGDDSTVFKNTYTVSAAGTINGEYKLDDTAQTGYYTLHADDSYIDFEVQEFRKPEYFLDIETEKKEFISGDDVTVIIKGEYFSGQPLKGKTVKYSVKSSDFYEYSYYSTIGYEIGDDYRYGWWGSKKEVIGGSVDLDSKGQAILKINSKSQEGSGTNQVYTIEANLSESSGEEPAFDRKNILVYSGDYGIYRRDYSYGTVVGSPLTIPLILVPRGQNVNVANQELKIEANITGYSKQEDNGKITWKEFKDKISDKTFKTNSQGEVDIKLIPERQGHYEFTVTGKDVRGNEIKKNFYAYVREKNNSYYWPNRGSDITVTPDKQEYKPGDTAKLTFYSEVPDRDMFLTFERARINRHQVFRIDGNTRILEVPIVATDMPNIFVEAASFSNKKLDYGQENLIVSAEQMRLKVNLIMESAKYGPGDTAQVTVETKDLNDQPVSAEVTLWAVDKAIFELTNNKLKDVFNTFWSSRYNDTVSGHSLEGIRVQTAEMGGCFAQGTKVLMSDGNEKNIEDVKPGELIKTRKSSLDARLVDAMISDTYKTHVSGYLLINGRLRMTDNHKILVNGLWKEAAEIKLGDVLLNRDGSEYVYSIEWLRGRFTVFNLHIDGYQTFFSDGIYVHNQKGGPAREVLKDTAYWNPSIITGADGRAGVNISLPDNLTTWALSAVASSSDTKVGQTKSEILVTKDVIVRPIIPNILREGDIITLSALVQNFTDNDRVFDVGLEFDHGEVMDPEKKDVKIIKGDSEELSWTVTPKDVGDASLKFTAYDTSQTDLGDVIVRTIPVKLFGFEEVKGYTAQGDKEYDITLHKDAVNENSSISLNISPTILGSLPLAMEYLIDYPYGCIEQTTSRFVPSIIAKRNAGVFREILAKKNIDEIIEKGLARLESLQGEDGGWGWWHGASDPFISAYVAEYLLEAQVDGYEIDENMKEGVERYFVNLQAVNSSHKVSKYYALTLLGLEEKGEKPAPSDDMDPVTLSLLIIANKKNGFVEKDESGFNKLISKVQRQGDLVYWESGDSSRFGSRSASTAMAIRALVVTGEERELAVKAVRFLSQNRKRHYWENSFATAQTIRAIVDLSKTGDEQSPGYTYKVSVGQKVVSEGYMGSVDQVVNTINLPVSLFSDGNTVVRVEKEGSGQLYSTLVTKEFRTDRDYKAGGSLKLERKIVNEKGENYSLGVGEVAKVTLTISGWPGSSSFAVVEDHLPSGMVPVIESFKNIQSSGDGYRRGSWGREYTADGVIFSSQYTPSNSFTYRARVVSSGEFYVPPATASLMYLPDIAGTSDAQLLKIEKDSRKLYDLPAGRPGLSDIRQLVKGRSLINILASFIAIIAALSLIIYKKRVVFKGYILRLKKYLQKKRTGKISTKLNGDEEEINSPGSDKTDNSQNNEV